MRRVSVLFLLTVLSLPYARAALCQAGAHEHPAEHQMPMHSSDVLSGPDDTPDCHERMKCQVTADLVVAPSVGADRVVAWLHSADTHSLAGPADLLRIPDSPPPRSI